MPGYDPKDPAFAEFLRAMILGTNTFFFYDPPNDDAKKLYGRIKGIPVADVPDLTDAQNREMKARLKVAEKDLLNVQRFCRGDASETGLVQFCQSI